MIFLALAWQLPALFTAVPVVNGLLPVKVTERVVPLLYFLVALVVMVLPTIVCLALGAAGVVTLLHRFSGYSALSVPDPEVKRMWQALGEGYALLATRFPAIPWPTKHVTINHGDDQDEHPGIPEPPPPPAAKNLQRIARL